MLIGPSSLASKLQPPTHKSEINVTVHKEAKKFSKKIVKILGMINLPEVGHTMPQVNPRGLSDKIAFAAP